MNIYQTKDSAIDILILNFIRSVEWSGWYTEEEKNRIITKIYALALFISLIKN